MVDSLPIPVCDNIRIRRCRLYPPKESGGAFRGYVASKRRYFYGLRVHLVVSASGEPVEFALEAGSEADVRVFKNLGLDLPEGSSRSSPTKPTPTTTTRICSKRRGPAPKSPAQEELQAADAPVVGGVLG
ncbi:MAG: transposase [Rubrobacter sp.]|nr:transposase [Rubrobacter sp.]